ncbi:flocculation protein FLO1 isoform X5 [Spatholobus suberectus]|nr:flocculation protein FLO1 isoform X5 [Spatholobus suberectus]
MRAYGEVATLLAGACGLIATDSKNIPIIFDNWPKVPKSYKDDCSNTLKNLFHFQTLEAIAKRYCLLTMARKYRDGKLNMWSSVYDTSSSREQLIAKVPYGIHKDQWLSFVDYHLRAEYQVEVRNGKGVGDQEALGPHGEVVRQGHCTPFPTNSTGKNFVAKEFLGI